jgi:hypothetical protein
MNKNLLSSFLEISPNFRKFIEDNECYTNWEDYYGYEESDKKAFYQYLQKQLDKEYYYCSFDPAYGSETAIGSKEDIENKYKNIKIENNTLIFYYHPIVFYGIDECSFYFYSIKEDKELAVETRPRLV